MNDPRLKLGDDGELEEIIEDFEEKPKRKRKAKYYRRILQIPLSLMLVFVTSVILLIFITYGLASSSNRVLVFVYSSPQPHPTETPGGYMDQIPSCAMLPITQKPRFAFRVSPLGSDYELVRIDADGSNRCRLTDNDFNDDQPAWSQDGKHIAFVAQKLAVGTATEYSLYSMEANGENLFTVIKGFYEIRMPTWSPDGTRLAFAGQSNSKMNLDIFVINLDGTNLVNLTNNPHTDSHPSWSPDGKSIAFVSDRAYQAVVGQQVNSEIYSMDNAGSSVKQLTSDKQSISFPRWSPDGQWIAFQEVNSIYLVDKNGKHERRLTQPNKRAYAPFWEADSNVVGYTTDLQAVESVNVYSGEIQSFPIDSNPALIAAWWPPA